MAREGEHGGRKLRAHGSHPDAPDRKAGRTADEESNFLESFSRDVNTSLLPAKE